MFENLIFKNQGEREQFEKYKRVKGVYLHKQVYDILLEANGAQTVTYYELSSLIRYDKNLRDKLYIYLATAEEYLRALICESYDISPDHKAIKKYSPEVADSIEKKEDSELSNLYFALELDFSALMELCAKKRLISIDENARKKIKELRNSTMHHAFLLFGKAKRLSALNDYFESLERKINVLIKLLPEEYREGFVSDIRRLNGYPDRQYLKKFYLEVEDGSGEVRIKR
ncbi:MAG: hypothetical protein IKD45_00755 [Clostridia bacterium]|nr:hypothetical protein [Clostridia bacterium]